MLKAIPSFGPIHSLSRHDHARSALFASVKSIFAEAKEEIHGGATASYIPILAKADPELFSVSICTVDGKQYSVGDVDARFSMQSCATPLVYALAAEDRGLSFIHRYVGFSPSGGAFNAVSLDHENKPWNPFVNAGAIVVASLAAAGLDASARFRYITTQVKRMAGWDKIGFSHATYLCEQETAWRNKALVSFMMANKVFPQDADAAEALDIYLQCCSIEVNTQAVATVAATLANAGVCPLTGEQVLGEQTVTATTSLLLSCGMYDYSGRWMSEVQLPSKSGVSGLIFVVIPGVMGIAIYSPPLDKHGNSVRGVEFCKRLVSRHGLGVFDRLFCGGGKRTALFDDPDFRQRAITRRKRWQNALLKLAAYMRKYMLLRAVCGLPLHPKRIVDTPEKSTADASDPHALLAVKPTVLMLAGVPGSATLEESALNALSNPLNGVVPLSALTTQLAYYHVKSKHVRYLSSIPREAGFGAVEVVSVIKLLPELHKYPILRAYFMNQMAVAAPDAFSQHFTTIFESVSKDHTGDVYTRLPIDELSLADPDKFAVSIVTVHGQRFDFGDVKHVYPVMGTVRALVHALAAHDNSTKTVDAWCGEEPTSDDPDTFSLMPADTEEIDKKLDHPKPWNPYLDSGALVLSALMGRAHEPDDRLFHDNGTRFSHIVSTFAKWAANEKLGFNNTVFLAQKEKRLKALAISYFLRGVKALPATADPVETAHVLFQTESIEFNTVALANVAAMFANAGVCPFSAKRLLAADVVRDVVSGMYGSGLGLFSGKAMFTTGLPCVTGSSGATIAVVPGVMGICIYSPRLNSAGVPPRAIRVCEELSQQYGYSVFQVLSPVVQPSSLHKSGETSDEISVNSAVTSQSDAFHRLHERVLEAQRQQTYRTFFDLCAAASVGDVKTVREAIRSGIDINMRDYDGRTPLHVAAADGAHEVVSVLIACGADVNAVDRWGHTPLDDAQRSKQCKVVETLQPLTQATKRGSVIPQALTIAQTTPMLTGVVRLVRNVSALPTLEAEPDVVAADSQDTDIAI